MSAPFAFACVAILLAAGGTVSPPIAGSGVPGKIARAPAGVDSAVENFSAALQRLVDLVGAAGGAILALVWSRVALSWFSTDVTKKVQAKDRARDALVGSLILVAALSGLIWALAQWVLTGQ
ncbi:MAG TPA: hypothetical protein VMH90_03040 [Thermoplasmata archaeon]|nr:hypothetical protein [Thermoplasmata archaeon]